MPETLELRSPCKINLLLNILGKRPDGYHELETIFFPVKLHDTLRINLTQSGIELSCNDKTLPCDATNLVYRAAADFLQNVKGKAGVRIHLEKRLPIAAGLGGGSANAATTLLGLNRLLGQPLQPAKLHELAASLGSDVPFFIQPEPALGAGRGERLIRMGSFPALNGKWLLLIHPGFGISTAWAYKTLANFPSALNGRPGRAAKLAELLQAGDFERGREEFYNSLEAPAFFKYPFLRVLQEFLQTEGAEAAMMSGSGSTTFAIIATHDKAEELRERVQSEIGRCWSAIAPC